MSYQQDMFALFKELTGEKNTIAVPRLLCRFAGSLEGGVFLTQMLFWCDKGHNPEGWIWKSYKEWETETFLSQYAVKKQADKLEALGVLEKKLTNANGAPTIHYRLNRNAFVDSIMKFLIIENQIFHNP